ncbi:transposase [Metallosphaera yellowstonensis]|uniref:transposase n=1 Tax=Metallosphaera yellowstonensis TaxID=1111107 RepID=UPI002479212F|nr:transposase [Metallosphaera yellowstonensis]
MRDNMMSRLRSNRAQGRVGPGDPRGGGGTPPSGIPPGVYYADLTLGGRAITVKLLVREHKRDSGTQARYLYTTDLSLSEEVEEACLAGDRGPPRDVKALGLLILEEGEASGLPLDLHHQQRRQGAVGELDLRSVEVFLMFSSVV